MSREIKFRAWCPQTKEIGIPQVDENFYYEIDTSANILCKNTVFTGKDLFNEEDPFLTETYDCVLMQSTGLTDKNRVGIYQGDIVKCDNCDYPAEVIWMNDYGMWALDTHNDNTRNNPMQSCYFEEATIIGNIYQNPELLTPFTIIK